MKINNLEENLTTSIEFNNLKEFSEPLGKLTTSMKINSRKFNNLDEN